MWNINVRYFCANESVEDANLQNEVWESYIYIYIYI